MKKGILISCPNIYCPLDLRKLPLKCKQSLNSFIKCAFHSKLDVLILVFRLQPVSFYKNYACFSVFPH